MMRKTDIRRASATALALLGGVSAAIKVNRRSDRAPEPVSAVRWTSDSCVHSLASDGSTLVLATRGALLRVPFQGAVESFTGAEAEWRAASPHAAVGVRHLAIRIDGAWRVHPLPAGTEGFAVAESGGRIWVGHSGGVTAYKGDGTPIRTVETPGPTRVLVATNNGIVAFGERGWFRLTISGIAMPIPEPDLGAPLRACVWNGTVAVAGMTDRGSAVAVLEGARWRRLQGPPSTAPVAAVQSGAGSPVLALSGDGVWRYDGSAWKRIDAPQDIAGDVSCVTERLGLLAIGTWTHGAWQSDGRGWTRVPTGSRLPEGDIQAIAEWHRRVWVATFDRGLWSWNGRFWRRWGTAEGLSSNAPRSLAALSDRLLVRHASGKVDSFDESHWRRNVLAGSVPRPWASSLSRDGVIGGWGSVTRSGTPTWGQTILPKVLSAETVTCASGDGVFIGTARSGVYRLTAGVATPMPNLVDGWVTALDSRSHELLAGTYSGETVYWSTLAAAPITVNLPDSATAVCLPNGHAPVAACRAGLWLVRNGRWIAFSSHETDGLEPQALCAGERGLWVGGRNGLAFIPWKDIDQDR